MSDQLSPAASSGELNDRAPGDDRDHPAAEQPPRRRKSFVSHEVVYAEVGASAAPDLLRFPPRDTTPFSLEQQIGQGASVFAAACIDLMTWNALRDAGIAVTDVQTSDGSHYAGVSYDSDGTPTAPGEPELRFSPEGEPFISVGTTAVFSLGREGAGRKARVVHVIDEPERAGFSLGSADTLGAIGETLLFVEHRSDDTVWACARGFHAPSRAGLLGLQARRELRQAERLVASVLQSLAKTSAHG